MIIPYHQIPAAIEAAKFLGTTVGHPDSPLQSEVAAGYFIELYEGSGIELVIIEEVNRARELDEDDAAYPTAATLTRIPEALFTALSERAAAILHVHGLTHGIVEFASDGHGTYDSMPCSWRVLGLSEEEAQERIDGDDVGAFGQFIREFSEVLIAVAEPGVTHVDLDNYYESTHQVVWDFVSRTVRIEPIIVHVVRTTEIVGLSAQY